MPGSFKKVIPAPILKTGFYLSCFVACLLIYVGVFNLIFQLVILPEASKNKQGFRVLLFKTDNYFQKSSKVFFSPDSRFENFKNKGPIKACAILYIKKSGFYGFRLLSDQNASLLIDNQLLIKINLNKKINANQIGFHLNKGPHLLVLKSSKGLPALFMQKPNDHGFHLLKDNVLRYPNLGNCDLWLLLLNIFQKLALIAMGFSLVIPVFKYLFPLLRQLAKPNTSKTLCSLVLIISIFWIVGFSVYYPMGVGKRQPQVRVDGYNYYAYLPSLFIHGDFSMKSILLSTQAYEYQPKSFARLKHCYTGLTFNPIKNTYVSDHTIGVSLLLLPFFILGHYFSLLFDQAQDGFSFIYQYSIGLGAYFYTILGFIFLSLTLKKHFSETITTIACLCLFLGTNLFNYSVNEISYSHIYSFCFIAMFIFLTEKWYKNPTSYNSIFLGIIWALITLIRIPNLVIIILFATYGLGSQRTIKSQIYFLLSQYKNLAIIALIFALSISPQLLLWKLTAGSFFINPQAYAKLPSLNIWHPEIFNVLFSIKKGLFIWSPILILALPGFLFMRKKLPNWFYPTIIYLGICTWIIASYWLWSYGYSFGHRGFIDIYPVLTLAFCSTIYQTTKINRRYILIFGSLIFVFIYINLCLTIQYWRSLIPGKNISWEFFQKIHFWSMF